MTDNMKKFLEEASKNGEFQDKLIQANKDYFQAVIDAAKEQKIDLSDEDIILLLKADKNHDGRFSNEELAALISEDLQSSETDADELKSAAGGTYDWSIEDHGYVTDCLCCLGGGGTGDKHQKTCACVLAGCGELTELGKEEAASGHFYNRPDKRFIYHGSESGPVAMWCALGGVG